MSKKKITLRFDEGLKKKHAVETGVFLPDTREYGLELKEFSPEERRLIIDVHGSIDADRLPQNKEDWMALIQSHLEARKEAARLQQERQAEESRAREEQQKAREEQEKAREEWILAHGSERLVKAHQMGYRCNGLFEKEFAAFYFPKALCDWHNVARLEEQCCPSLEALKRVEDYKKRFPKWSFDIVWLSSPPLPFEYEEDFIEVESQFTAREAIVITIPGFSSYIIEEV